MWLASIALPWARIAGMLRLGISTMYQQSQFFHCTLGLLYLRQKYSVEENSRCRRHWSSRYIDVLSRLVVVYTCNNRQGTNWITITIQRLVSDYIVKINSPVWHAERNFSPFLFTFNCIFTICWIHNGVKGSQLGDFIGHSVLLPWIQTLLF